MPKMHSDVSNRVTYFQLGLLALLILVTACTKSERNNPFDPGAPEGISEDTLNLLLEYNADCEESLNICITQAKTDSLLIFEDSVRLNSTIIFNVTSLSGSGVDTVGSPEFLLSGTLSSDHHIRIFDIDTINVLESQQDSTAWQVVVQLEVGENQIEVFILDDQNNNFKDTINIFYSVTAEDREAPVIKFTEMPEDFVTTREVTMQGTLTDASGIKSFTINDVEVPVVNGVWNYSTSLAFEDNNFIFKATDSAVTPNSVTVNRVIHYSLTDKQAPNLKILSPLTTDVLNINVDVPVSGTVSDESGILHVVVNGDTAALVDTTWSVLVDLLPGATSTITAVATDSVGNSSTVPLTVTYDSTAGDVIEPSIVLISPEAPNNENITDSIITLLFAVTDPSGIQSVTVNNIVVTTNPDGYYFFEDTLTEGKNSFDVVAVDASLAGNTKSKTFNLYYYPIDSIGPVITLVSPADSTVHAGPSINIQVEVRDPSGIPTGGVIIGGANATAVGGGSDKWEAPYTFDDTLGVYYVDVVAIDQIGNPTTERFTFGHDPSLRDTISPVITFTQNSVQPYTVSNPVIDTIFSDSILFEFTVVDEYPNILSYVGEIDDSTNVAAAVFNVEAGAWQATLALDTGQTSFVVLVVDGSSNQNADTSVFAVFRGIPLDSITVAGINLTQASQLQSPVITWYPPNVTYTSYEIRATDNTNLEIVSITENKQQVFNLNPSGEPELTEVEIVPLSDPSKSVIISILVQ